MKDKNLILLFICYMFTLSISAQFGREEIKKSKIVKDEISLSVVDKDNVDVYIDDGDKIEKTLKEKDYFQVKSNELRVYADFVNPFKYMFRSSEKELDDELFVVSQEFLQSSASYISGIKTATRNTKATTKKEISLEPELVELFMELEAYQKDFFSRDTFDIKLKKSFEDLNFAETNTTIAKNYKSVLKRLEGIAKISEIEIVLLSTKSSLENNQKHLDELKKRFETLKIAGTILSFNKKEVLVKNHINNIIEVFKGKIKVLETLKTELDNKYSKIIALFETIEKRKHKLGNNKFLLSKIVDIKESKRHEITVVLEKIKFNNTESAIKIESSKSFIINVRKKTTFIPVLSSGVLYTNVSFNQYGTDSNEAGETIIVQTEDKENELTIATYLNLYFNNNWNLPMFLQFGVGPSKEKPLFFLGGGIELAPKFTLSSGAVFTWMPTLNDLTVGDVVGGSSIIDKDISYDFDLNPKFYIGISIDITSK